MLFNSYVFLFLFLPITIAVFALLGALHRNAALIWLIACSLFFYGYWNPRYVPLIVGATIVNYLLGNFWLLRPDAPARKAALVLGLIFNLGLLAYFKYANLLVDSFNTVTGASLHLHRIILPLAISFFVFQKIAFLVDSYRGNSGGRNFLEFFLFVTFFPQLIAGPIVRPHEMLPQWRRRPVLGVSAKNLSIGLTLFVLGLAKKVLIADPIAPSASRIFDAAAHPEIHLHGALTLTTAWLGALAYAVQIYFDFSGYSDMAIGLARIFGVRLPINFNSPYKAVNLIDFWRRWHITLSRVLRDYLYIPLGGNRRGSVRRYTNLLVTMLLGGLWHGANWTFVCWGGLHGLLLIINHGWHALRIKLGYPPPVGHKPRGVAARSIVGSPMLGRMIANALTFLAVVVAWVFFRADNFHAAGRMLAAMIGRFGSGFDQLRDVRSTFIAVLAMLGVALTMPNTQQIMRWARPALGVFPPPAPRPRRKWQWEPEPLWAVGVAAVAIAAVLHMSRASEFVYYQF
jgi:alginate O-acetyltransferase complex protein AlgI